MQSTQTSYSLRTTLERFVEPCILLALLKGKSHGYELLEKLKVEFKHEVNPGSLYRTLNKMKKSGLVEQHRFRSNVGPTRKIYQITLSGKLALDAWVTALESQQREVQNLLNKYNSLQQSEQTTN